MPMRDVARITDARPSTEGAGVKINRLSGFPPGPSMDPFLMLDEIHSDRREEFAAGFPPHPHRGFETVTYMREGGFSHTDSMGNTGTITAGGAQWMTAGSGVIHSEMPGPDADRIHGFQFWLNLPAHEKMRRPAYRDIQGEEIVTRQAGHAAVRLIAGVLRVDGTSMTGVVKGGTTRPLIADLALSGAAPVSIETEPGLTQQLYVYRGEVEVAGRPVRRGQLATLGDGDGLSLAGGADSGLLLFGGRPINEPVAHYGPFVMNTAEELEQAMRDFRNGRLVRA